MDTAEIEWANPLLPNDIGLELASDVEANHKTKDKPQTGLSFVHQTPNRNKEKWALPLFEIVQSKSCPK